MTDSDVVLKDRSLASARNVSLTYRVPEAGEGLVGAMTVAGQVDMNYYFAVTSYCYSQSIIEYYYLSIIDVHENYLCINSIENY